MTGTKPVIEEITHHSSMTLTSAHTHTVWLINWSPKGDLLASGSFDSTALIWTNHKFDQRLDQADAQDLEDEPGRARLPILDGEEEVKESWECLMSLKGHESEVKGVAWNRNGNLLATCSWDKSVWIWEILVGNELQAHQNVILDDEGYKVIAVLIRSQIGMLVTG
ncbi:cytosolic iron-sulfur protein assembly [Puccinia graminis f. sp. tritici]|uniref:Cytosolic iron-sulfur protein assembly n=1 Tax=Puccinia graminis f. sp. tritici TaxID=56615 RepID=A0A5B0MHP3_PUCGR|nr:cytosolic iron-sulfur protein assembly [Puccinia graminis f. sp. tritici]